MPSVGASSDTEAKADVGGGQMEQVRAELGLGAYAFGVGAAGAIGGGVAAVRSGAAARAINKVRKQEVFLHGSPQPNLKTLEPRTGSRALPSENVVYGWDLKSPGASNWATKNSVTIRNRQDQNAGTVYVAKAPKSAIKNRADDVNWSVVTSSQPAKVVKGLEIPKNMGDEYSDSFKEFDRMVKKAVKRAGGKMSAAPQNEASLNAYLSSLQKKKARGGGKNKR